MLTDPQPADAWLWGSDTNSTCEGCGRSLISRFGGATTAECPPCEAEFDLLHRAGRLELDGWTIQDIGPANSA